LRRLIGFLAVIAVLALSGIVFAGMALAQGTATTAPTATTMRPGTPATTATTARATTATTARPAAPAATQARTGARTDLEVTLAGTAFVVGGGLLFFAQPLRRARRQS
jgi:hypothetical protein